MDANKYMNTYTPTEDGGAVAPNLKGEQACSNYMRMLALIRDSILISKWIQTNTYTPTEDGGAGAPNSKGEQACSNYMKMLALIRDSMKEKSKCSFIK